MKYLIYATDSHHSYASRDIIGLASSVKNVLRIIRAQCKKEGTKLSDEDKHNLLNIKQTQGYAGHGEFQYESIEMNKLL